MSNQKQMSPFWLRLAANRSFVGNLIANPELTIHQYGVGLSDKDIVALAEVADSLFAHASETLSGVAKAIINDCENDCHQNCK